MSAATITAAVPPPPPLPPPAAAAARVSASGLVVQKYVTASLPAIL